MPNDMASFPLCDFSFLTSFIDPILLDLIWNLQRLTQWQEPSLFSFSNHFQIKTAAATCGTPWSHCVGCYCVSACKSSTESVFCLPGCLAARLPGHFKPLPPPPGLLGKLITGCRSVWLAAVTSDDLRSHRSLLTCTVLRTLPYHIYSKPLSIYCGAVLFNLLLF